MSVRFLRVVVYGLSAFVGAALLFVVARSRRWGAPSKDLPENAEGGPFTAITLDLPGAPAWVLISSALLGAIVFGTATWLMTGLRFRQLV